jgi:carbon-monoxide dehydrogenase large subunit
MPGVLGVWTGRLAAANYGPFTCGLPLKTRDGSPLGRRAAARCRLTRSASLASRCRGGGDANRPATRQAVGSISSLPAVTDAAEAAKPGAPQLYDHIPNNVALDYHCSDTDKINAAFASAAHVTRLDIVNTRVAVVSMEPRVALGATRQKGASRCRCRPRACPATRRRWQKS